MKNISLITIMFWLISISVYSQTEPLDTDGDGYRNVSTLDQLKWISQNSIGWGYNYELDNDINAGDTKNWNGGLGFSPIGMNVAYFTGKFNGNGYKIDSLYINRASQEYIGLFGITQGAEIMNIGLANADIKGYSSVGGLVGYNSGSSTISNSYSTGSVKGSSTGVGGLVGYNSGSSTISNSYSTGSATGSSSNVGGLVGYNSSSSSINNCYSTGSVTGSNTGVGGLVGTNSEATISNCHSTGSVSGGGDVGGLVGYNSRSPISNSYSTGSVTGSGSNVGGLAGYNYYLSTISNSYSTGSVTGSSSNVGGLVGQNKSNSTISNSYSTGSVTGSSSNVGGLVGYNESSSVSGSFWDKETSGKATSAAGYGRTTAQMKTTTTFTDVGWNFDFLWDIDSSYPYISIDTTYRPIDTDGNGYLNISTLTDLRWLSESGMDFVKKWELDTNINAAATKNWNDTLGFSPIGNNVTKFTGKFNGNGYKIDSLFINRTTQDDIGLFRYTRGAEIKNIGLTNANIKGRSNVGCLVGLNELSIISNSYSYGIVSGYSNVGCLVGYNSSIISNSYSTGSVTGSSSNVGGLVGYNSSTISNSYSTGSVTGSSSNVGGLVGYNESSNVSGSFWDKETSGKTTSAAGYGRTTAQMKTKTTFTDVGWNFDFIWDIDSSYPYISIDTTYRPTDKDDDGYLNISTLTDLRWLSESGLDLDKNWELDTNINAVATKNWNDSFGFSPIGNNATKFTGKFNGNGYKIDSLYIDRATQDFIGLFWYTQGAEIKNIGLTNATIKGGRYVGGLVGFNSSSTISNSYSTGSVTASSSSVGGLVGVNHTSTISNCYSTGSLTANSAHVGGLVGENYSSTISNSYSTGSVTGSSSNVGGLVGSNYSSSSISNSYNTGIVIGGGSYVGGLVGFNNTSPISNCYSTGSVSGSGDYVGGFVGINNDGSIISNSYSLGSVTGNSVYVGGLVGRNSSSTVNGSFWDKEISGKTTSAGGIGKTSLQMKTQSTFDDAGWDFDIIWNIDNITNKGYPFHQWQPKIYEFNIHLSSGWNLISSYIQPQLPDTMNNIMSEISNNLLIAKNNGGQVYIPSYDINTIGRWNVTQGYLVYMSAADTLSISGSEVVPSETPIQLSTGWNMIAYLRNTEMSAELALASITDNENLLIAKTLEGLVYIPSFQINTIGNMKPGVGYKVYVTTSDALVYPDN